MPTPGPLELVIILVIALLILGPGKLPDVGAALGKSIREFRKASTDVHEAVKVDTSPLPYTAPSTPVAQASLPPNPAVVPTPGDLISDPAAPSDTVTGTPAAHAPSSEPTPGTR